MIFEINEATMNIQERALIAMYRRGELEPHTVTFETCNSYKYTDENGVPHKAYKKARKTFFKVKDPKRYGIRKEPREEVKFHKCCASCQFKEIDDPAPNVIRRICKRTGTDVTLNTVCDDYQMKDWMKRI